MRWFLDCLRWGSSLFTDISQRETPLKKMTNENFPAVVAANYFVEKAKKAKRDIGLLKVIKLVYLAHGWYLSLNKEPLIREQIEDWKHGPVVRSVYDAFKGYGKRPIKETAKTGIGPEMKRIEKMADDETIQSLKNIGEFYRDWTPWQLSELTHEEGSPWHKYMGRRQKSG